MRIEDYGLVGFLAADDERVTGTIGAIQRDLTRDGLVSLSSNACWG